MYWICFGDGPKGLLSVARHDIAPEMAADHILALLDNYSEGDITDVTDRATASVSLPARRSGAGRQLDGRVDRTAF